MLEKKTVLAIVVTYHPDQAFAERFEGLVGQVGGVLVVDNNSGTDAVSMLREAATRLNMTLILNPQNLGLATALNIGVAHAMARGYEWALLFDQDSLPGDHIVEGLREAYDQFPRKEKLAIIGSNYSARQTGGEIRPSELATDACLWRERKVVITSGSLVSLPVYQELGPFREDYFVDCVDFEYCLRARSKGFKVAVTCKPLMVHGIGQPTRHRLPWREIDVSNHSQIRRYYMIRNIIDLAKNYLLREPAWVLTSLWSRFKLMIVICIFEEDRLAKVSYSLLGLCDGLFSKFDRKLG